MRSASSLIAVLLCSGCMPEQSERVQAELTRLEAAAVEGTSLVSRALTDPTFAELGEGVRSVEMAVRELEMLEGDPAISDGERLQAILIQVRAWDDLANAFERGAAEAETDSSAGVLLEKATPARQAAEEALARAELFSCERGLADHPAFQERPACIAP